MTFFGLCFILYFFKLSAGHALWVFYRAVNIISVLDLGVSLSTVRICGRYGDGLLRNRPLLSD